MTPNAFTVDLEDWYHVCSVDGLADPSGWNALESRVVKNTERIIALLRKYRTKATFFVLGYIAEQEPDLIRAIKQEGHEIATHGYYHRRVFEMQKEEFEKDIQMSITVLSDITGDMVVGFRAPEWSIRRTTPWSFEVLRKAGILYDSSMVPLTRMGDRTYPRYPVKINTSHGEIWEFPLTTSRFFVENLPFTGGLPLRLTPYFYIISKLRRINRAGLPGLVYIHPWEFDPDLPRVPMPLNRRFMHYFNLKSTSKKIEGLLRHLRFRPVREILGIR